MCLIRLRSPPRHEVNPPSCARLRSSPRAVNPTSCVRLRSLPRREVNPPSKLESIMPSIYCGDCPNRLAFDSVEMLHVHYSTCHHALSKFNCGQAKCSHQGQFLNKTSLFRHIRNHLKTDPCPTSSSGGQQQQSSSGSIISQPLFSRAQSTSSSSNNHPLFSFTPQPSTSFECLSEPTAEDENFEGQVHVLDFENVPSVDLKHIAAKSVMELRSKASLTGKSLERFQSVCTNLLDKYKTVVTKKVCVQLRQNNVSDEVIKDVIHDIPNVDDLFVNLKTIEDQLRVFSEEFGMVCPQGKFLWSRLDKRLDSKTNMFVQTQVNSTFRYVPIIETLKTILSNKTRRQNIFKDYSSTDGILRSYFDGYHYKNHPFVKKYPDVINLLLFFDELEVANALGSRTTIHKLGVFFFQLLNGPPELCSRLDSIHLLILAHAQDLKKSGAYEKVLAPFIRDMKKLSSDEGVEMVIDGQPIVVRALLTALTADTLAAHDLLGYLAPGAKCFCRLCMITREELRQDSNIVGNLRNRASHDQQVQEVIVHPKSSTKYGVKRACPLNQLPYFHCCDSSIFDAFHDLLEGIVPLDLKLVLRHFIIVREYLTIDEFNMRVESFSYGLPDSKNRPSPNFTIEMLTSGKKLKQTGSQYWCLVRALPFLLSDSKETIEIGDTHMELIFLLQDIMKTVFSFEVSDYDICQLETTIFKHNELFKTLFIDTEVELQPEEGMEEGVDNPDEVVEEENEVQQPQQQQPEEGVELDAEVVDNPDQVVGEENGVQQPQQQRRKKRNSFKVYMINKLHHLKHYPETIRKYGPLVRMWCAKFEGRLKIFRQHSAICCNFTNVVKTMSEMFQLSNVIQEEEEESNIDFKKQQTVTVTVGSMGLVGDLFLNKGLGPNEKLLSTSSATVHGEEYRPGLFVRLPSNVRYSPKFALISDIYIHKTSVFLVVKPWKVVCLSARYNCYIVAPQPDSMPLAINAVHLNNFRAISPWTVNENDNIYLSLRSGSF